MSDKNRKFEKFKNKKNHKKSTHANLEFFSTLFDWKQPKEQIESHTFFVLMSNKKVMDPNVRKKSQNRKILKYKNC